MRSSIESARITEPVYSITCQLLWRATARITGISREQYVALKDAMGPSSEAILQLCNVREFSVSFQGGLVLRRMPAVRPWLWRVSYDFMAARFKQPGWIFMNYGFVSLDPAAVPVELGPADERFRRGIELYLAVIGPVDVAGRDVLEVGSGRGGGSSYISRCLHPKSVVGLDFSRRAVDLCNQRFDDPRVSFTAGSAEAMPFADATFDVVVNVESSHCYQSMETFLSEVHRVLRPGGYFCTADFRPTEGLAKLRRQLTSTPMRLIEDADITLNVRRSLDAANADKRVLVDNIRPRVIRKPMRWFSAVDGTGIFEALHDGRTVYTRWILQKDG